MGYYLTGKRHRLELGGGLCPGFGSSEGLAAMAIYGNAGYRYQKKKGLIFGWHLRHLSEYRLRKMILLRSCRGPQ
jgi:hypothetical protein